MRTWIIRTTMAAVLSVASASAASAQTGTVMGTVTDRETAQPLPGAQVTVVGTQRGVITNDDGRYILQSVPTGEVTLRVQRIGYASAEQVVTATTGGSAVADFALQPQAVDLERLVVTGYGEQRREDLTGAIASVSSEDFVQAPARDAAALIQGKIAGLVVTQPTGDPRADSEIMLRGITTVIGDRSPLVLVDGVPVTGYDDRSPLELVASQDIESIDVLKDGSAAAVYGSRASNGVILITTKKYKTGMKPTISYNGYASVQSLYNQPDFLDADDYRRLAGEGFDFIDHGFETDWQDQVLRQPVSFTHNLTVTGGAEDTHYSASLGYEDTQGIFRRSDQQEMTGRFNIGHSMWEGKLQADLNLLSRVENSTEGIDFDYTWRQALIRNPTDRVYADDGTYQVRGIYFYPNPVGMINEFNGDEEDRSVRLHGTLTYRPFTNLRLSALAGTEKYSQLNGTANTSMAVRSTLNSTLFASRYTRATEDRILELTGTYSNDFEGHYVTLLGGYSYQDFEDENFWARNEDFPTDLFGYNELGIGDALGEGRARIESGKSSHKVIGFFSRLNYDWNNRFLLMGSLRYEGNSRFGANHKWGLFPGVSAGWRISEEGFMDGMPFDDLKLRLGYGVTGIAPAESYLSLTSYEYDDRFPFRGNWVQGISPARNPNPDLRWERKDEINVGLDYSLFDYRLAGSLDVYRRDTRDMLYEYDVPSPPFLFNEILANVGHMRNNGVEAELTYDIVRSADLRWQASANWSTNTNELVSLSNEFFQLGAEGEEQCFNTGYTGEPVQKSTHRVCVGEPIGNFWGLKSVGIDENGAWIVEDTLGNPISIEEAGDQYHVLGNGLPDHYVGFSTAVDYKAWDLSVNMRGAFGHQILNFQRMFYENPTNTEYNMLESAFDPVFGETLLDYELDLVSYYVEDGDYWKVDNVTLGYTFEPSVLPGFLEVVTGARLYVSGRNLLVLTGYKGMDPEVSLRGLDPGNDFRDTYPTTRMFTAGLGLTF
ncbi:MAG: SusC/RagA family TonB-linked outer membrane protein [Gemmatimonadetes bacterium]|nr:SusC/RagA family TonB-linked outer membrane protein [Gemmatimonadota bacterium]